MNVWHTVNSGGIKYNQPFSRCWTEARDHTCTAAAGSPTPAFFSQSTSLFLKMASRRVISGRSHLAMGRSASRPGAH